MTILAFLQSAWMRPGKYTALLVKAIGDQAVAERIVEKSAGYKRLVTALGQDTCDRIRWAYASLDVGTSSGFAGTPDPFHMAKLIKELHPDLVIIFGDALKEVTPTVWSGPMLWFKDPAPGKSTDRELAAFAERLHHKIAHVTAEKLVRYRETAW